MDARERLSLVVAVALCVIATASVIVLGVLVHSEQKPPEALAYVAIAATSALAGALALPAMDGVRKNGPKP